MIDTNTLRVILVGIGAYLLVHDHEVIGVLLGCAALGAFE